ncbi:MAG: hypothetical protein ACRC3B_14860 [Bacteroidia bacterium]
MNKAQQLVDSASELNYDCSILEGDDAKKIIDSIFLKFDPKIRANHLSIQSDESMKLSTDKFELDLSNYFDESPVIVFFEQYMENRNKIFVLSNGQQLSDVIGNTGGLEYFISNKEQDFLISVNWYSIEIIGSIKERLSKIISDKLQ